MTTDEHRESQEPMIADDTYHIGKIDKTLEKADFSGTENNIGKWPDHLAKAVVNHPRPSN